MSSPQHPTTQASDSEDPVAVIYREAEATARYFGIHASQDAAQALIDRILLQLGGRRIYMPSPQAQHRHKSHAEIRAAYTGNNLRQLSQETGLSLRHLRRIVTPENHPTKK